MSIPYPYGTPLPSLDRVRYGITRRAETDYQIDFWSALGWSILTCGVYSFYIFYKLVWRSVEHNRRRLEVLDAATTLAWERATAVGRGEELTPHFQVIAQHLGVLRHVAGEFREPGLWLVIALVSGVAQFVAYVLLDQDLVRHDAAELAVEHELAALYTALGAPLAFQPHQPKTNHSYVGRVVATLATCGIYGLWWIYDLYSEGNAHHRANWASEDALWVATGQLAAA